MECTKSITVDTILKAIENAESLDKIQEYAAVLNHDCSNLIGLDYKYQDTQGRNRIGVIKRCGICPKLYVTRKDSSQAKYCSTTCYVESRKKQDTLTCAGCSKTFTRPPSKKKSSKSGFYFCGRKCKEQAQKIGGIKEIMPDHYGKSEDYRRLF